MVNKAERTGDVALLKKAIEVSQCLIAKNYSAANTAQKLANQWKDLARFNAPKTLNR